MNLFKLFSKRSELPVPGEALAGRPDPIATAETHAVNGRRLAGPYPDGTETAVFALGCFWGAERLFWRTDGVWVTVVGYIGGATPNPTYREVCSGMTGHTEGVLVVYDPKAVDFEALLKVFWEGHDPTQGMRQGNDVGTQYRSAIYTTTPAQLDAAKRSLAAYQAALAARRYPPITTEVAPAPPFYFAEDDHQQYLHKTPGGYCGLGGTGVACPIAPAATAA